eukprot:NODE_4990_length_1823_cov_3.158608.p2 GENE.NODE_4990_length_1823_cov_3.158608~~NODE_4990_length_1823_cov_3.158608.p2  ORF type:complete len:154 (-),score=50.05 NODE_4990_length_1823_cov_3.158608:77-538(-)
MQELQVQPELLTPAHWDIIAEAAHTSREYASVLRDAHWAGGDPSRGDVYGYASFACPPCVGLVGWRNPLDVRRNFTFTLREAFALPQVSRGGAPGSPWRLASLWPSPGAVQALPTSAATQLALVNDSATLDEVLQIDLNAFDFHAFLTVQVSS